MSLLVAKPVVSATSIYVTVIGKDLALAVAYCVVLCIRIKQATTSQHYKNLTTKQKSMTTVNMRSSIKYIIDLILSIFRAVSSVHARRWHE